ncbi:prepilin-type N-terminal cleavage/methylation domain-containing protein [Candidatus Neptunichlamydia sp. REUL1]|uniref:prepilin-type N-terminal cleavage/methylation domain-containing protein n=1 Tax=Candidatus Neptunichlamydia sp. REUL1 TaxID=3064277 RepID=UPI002930FC57|nr:prepilin-type N-terminal cleavage/methylation domain-containing protein [Candidatus Neptunochlamydia sp. REUL1]
MKKKYAMTLLEIMIVIFIIGIIGSVIGYNMRGSLDKGKAFKTKEGVNKLYEIVQLEEAQGNPLSADQDLETAIERLLTNSGLVRRPSDLMKDGWGNTYEFKQDGKELRITSDKYESYCEAKGIKDKYPWDNDADSHS